MSEVTFTLSWQVLATIGAGIGAVSLIIGLVFRFVHWVDRQKQQDKEIVALREKHEADNTAIREEQQLLIFGLLACLKGLKSLGCNGPVTEAISKTEKFINKRAHEEAHK